MNELDTLIELIKDNAKTNKDTSSDTWSKVIELLKGNNDVETWDNLRNMIFIHIE